MEFFGRHWSVWERSKSWKRRRSKEALLGEVKYALKERAKLNDEKPKDSPRHYKVDWEGEKDR